MADADCAAYVLTSCEAMLPEKIGLGENDRWSLILLVTRCLDIYPASESINRSACLFICRLTLPLKEPPDFGDPEAEAVLVATAARACVSSGQRFGASRRVQVASLWAANALLNLASHLLYKYVGGALSEKKLLAELAFPHGCTEQCLSLAAAVSRQFPDDVSALMVVRGTLVGLLDRCRLSSGSSIELESSLLRSGFTK